MGFPRTGYPLPPFCLQVANRSAKARRAAFARAERLCPWQ